MTIRGPLPYNDNKIYHCVITRRFMKRPTPSRRVKISEHSHQNRGTLRLTLPAPYTLRPTPHNTQRTDLKNIRHLLRTSHTRGKLTLIVRSVSMLINNRRPSTHTIRISSNVPQAISVFGFPDRRFSYIVWESYRLLLRTRCLDQGATWGPRATLANHPM